MKKTLAVFLTLILALSFVGCGEKGPSSDTPMMPEDLQAFVDDLVVSIDGLGEELSGEWGDKHAQLMEAGDGMDNPLYAELKADLDAFRISTGAYYVYGFYPDENNDYLITVDGSAEPDDFGTNYGWEIQFDEAWAGEAAAARSGWDDDVPIWSAFAPVYNSAGEVVCIVGIDMPCEILENYPEWNRDREEWNGIKE